MESESAPLIHFEDRSGRPLCGAPNAQVLDGRRERVCCPLCQGLLRVQGAVFGLVAHVQDRVTERLVEAQRDPGARALGNMVRLVVQIDREKRRQQPRRA